MFTFVIGLQIMFNDLFHSKHSEKPRAFFTDLFFCQNFNFNSLVLLNGFIKSTLTNTSKTFLLKLEFNRDDYNFKIAYSNKNIFYAIFKNTVLEPFFVNKEISIYKNNVLIYCDGFETPYYESLEIDLNNTIWFAINEMKKNSEELSNKELEMIQTV